MTKHYKDKIRTAFFILSFLTANAVHAQNVPYTFTVMLNDIPYTMNQNVRPCYPVMAEFAHPNPNVTRVRMRYPYNHAMHMFFPIGQKVRIHLHENFMRTGKLSLSDFIAEDETGNTYGQITLTFIPLDPAAGEICDNFPNS